MNKITLIGYIVVALLSYKLGWNFAVESVKNKIPQEVSYQKNLDEMKN